MALSGKGNTSRPRAGAVWVEEGEGGCDLDVEAEMRAWTSISRVPSACLVRGRRDDYARPVGLGPGGLLGRGGRGGEDQAGERQGRQSIS